MGYFEDVLSTVLRIPRGKVATYGDVARAAGHPGMARQVAWALRSASARGIAWQRVIGAGGRILLPGEAGLHQRLLLEMEGVAFADGRIQLDRYAFRFSAPRRPKAAQRDKRIHGRQEAGVPDP